MAIEKAKELLEAVKTDPKAKELIQEAGIPRNDEEFFHLYAEIASRLGFDITEEEIRAGIIALIQERREKTAADIEKLSDVEVEKAAGGSKGHSECKDSYLNGENCRLTDGCDHVWQDYDGYICKNTSNGHECPYFNAQCDETYLCGEFVINQNVIDSCSQCMIIYNCQYVIN